MGPGYFKMVQSILDNVQFLGIRCKFLASYNFEKGKEKKLEME